MAEPIDRYYSLTLFPFAKGPWDILNISAPKDLGTDFTIRKLYNNYKKHSYLFQPANVIYKGRSKAYYYHSNNTCV
jgi:hypothetical protein